MKRRQKTRSRRHRDTGDAVSPQSARRAAPTSVPAPKTRTSDQNADNAPDGGGERSGGGLLPRICLGAVLVVFAGMVFLQFSLRWRAVSWPMPGDVGLSALRGALAAGLLVAAGGIAVLTRRAVRARRPWSVRITVLLAVVLAGAFLGIRVLEYRGLYDRGLWRPGESVAMHDRPDLYYVQAVRQRLAELFQRLEERRVNKPHLFTLDDQQRLELVNRLQGSMVAWTEEEIAHWLEDVQRRRDVMQLLAYQVYPRAGINEEARRIADEEFRYLVRQRQWFVLFEDYARRKVQWLSPPDSGAAVEDEAITAEQMVERDRAFQADLMRLGLTEWPYVVSLQLDLSDPALARERLNQIRARIDALDARRLYHEELLEPLWDNPHSPGLNDRHPWLRLPVQLAGGNAWLGGFFALTTLHLGLVIVIMLISLAVLVARRGAGHGAGWANLQWWWLATAAVGAVLFPLLYLSW